MLMKKYLNCFTKRNIQLDKLNLDKLNQFIIINDEIFLKKMRDKNINNHLKYCINYT